MSPVQKIFDFLPYGNTLSKSLIYFLGSALIAFIISPLIIRLLIRLNIRRVSKGDEISKMDESKGKLGVPIMGGLIIIITIFVITFLFNWEREFTWLPIGALILSASVGGLDDILNVFGKIRKQPKPVRLHFRLMKVHKSFLKRIYYFFTLPWAAFKRFLLFVGSRPESGLQVHEKILIQAFIGVTVGLWIYLKVGWDSIWIPYILRFEFIRTFFDIIPVLQVDTVPNYLHLGWLMVPFITLTIMTVTNAVNITDGMDGLAGGLTFMAFVGYAIIAFNFSMIAVGYRHISYLSATAAGALLAYLYFNVKPAKIQMGDFGSLGIGTLLSVIAIALNREFTLLFLAGVPLFNTIFAIILQRLSKRFRGRKLFRITPLHYHFEMKGWTEEQVVMRFWIIGGLLVALGVWVAGL